MNILSTFLSWNDFYPICFFQFISFVSGVRNAVYTIHCYPNTKNYVSLWTVCIEIENETIYFMCSQKNNTNSSIHFLNLNISRNFCSTHFYRNKQHTSLLNNVNKCRRDSFFFERLCIFVSNHTQYSQHWMLKKNMWYLNGVQQSVRSYLNCFGNVRRIKCDARKHNDKNTNLYLIVYKSLHTNAVYFLSNSFFPHFLYRWARLTADSFESHIV